MKRRLFLVGGAALAAGAGAYIWFGTGGAAAGFTTLTPREAAAKLANGEILLVDIRRPDEWARTGIAEGAVPIDMRAPDFVDQVKAARQAEDQPIALICARGVRSRRVTNQFVEAGIGPVIDIPEGMLGSFTGPGWIKAGLPLVAWEG